MTHVPEVDRMSLRLANAASIDTVNCSSKVILSLSGTSRTDDAKLIDLSTFPLSSSSFYSNVVSPCLSAVFLDSFL